MKTWKQWLSLLLCLCMLVGYFPELSIRGFAEGEPTTLVEVEPETNEEVISPEEPETDLPEESPETPEELPEPSEEETEEIPEEPEETLSDSTETADGVWDKPTVTFVETNHSIAVKEELDIVAEYRSKEAPGIISWNATPTSGLQFSNQSVSGPSSPNSKGERTWLISVTVKGVKVGSYDVALCVDGYTSAPIRILVADPASHYTVLVLDVSGSMSGTPIAEQRKAAKNFCNTLINARGKNYIAIVTFSTNAKVAVEFTDNLSTLNRVIDGTSATNQTNTNEALEFADDLIASLPKGKNIKSNIVLCSDGLPVNGKELEKGHYTKADNSGYALANYCYKTATEMKQKGRRIYTLGFFHKLSGNDLTFGKKLMSDIASFDCYYDVTKISDLDFLFQDIAEEIIVAPAAIEITEILPITETIDRAVYRITAAVTNNSTTQPLTNLSVNLDSGDHAEITMGEQKQSVGTLGANATTEVRWQITVDRAGYPDGGAHEFYVSAVSDQTVSSSVKGTIALKAANALSNELDFSTDVWNFHNFSEEKIDPKNADSPLVPHKISERDKNVFLEDAVPSERQQIEDFMFSEGSNGHCFGMALSTILSKMNIFDIEAISNAKNLREATLNDRIWSILCYYQVLQYFNTYAETEIQFRTQTVHERLTELAEKADAVKNGGSPVLLSFQADNWGAHAVVAYALEPGSWKYHGTTYDHRILIYDSNAANGLPQLLNPIWKEDYCLYFNERTDEWIVPAYYKIGSGDHKDELAIVSTNPNAEIIGACTDLGVLNLRNYSEHYYNYVSKISCKVATEFRLANSTGQYIIGGNTGSISGPTVLIKYYDHAYNPDSPGPGTLHIVLPDDTDAYTVSTVSGNAEELDFSIAYADRYLSVTAEAAEGAVFSPDGPLGLSKVSGDFQLVLADDNVPAAEFNTFTISGNTDGSVSAMLTEEGLKLTGDNLQGITVKATDGDITDTVVIDAETTEVDLKRNGSDLIVVQDEGVNPVSMEQQYLTMTVGDKKTLQVNISSAEEASSITWSLKRISGQENAVSVTSKGVVTALKPGTAEVAATVTIGGKPYTARCRVDVVDKSSTGHPIADEVTVHGVTLLDSKATVELYRTDYTRIGVLLNLSQNQMTAFAENSTQENTGHAIQAARFADAVTAQYFTLRVADDRTLEIIPTAEAIAVPTSVKNAKSAILLTVDGTEFTTQPLTLTVKKTLPTVKAKAVKLNSFDHAPGALVFTGANVVAVEPIGSLPDGFRLDGMNVVYSGAAPKASAKINLMAAVENLAVQRPVTVSVSVSRTEPAVKLSTSSISLLAGTADQAQVKVTASGSLDVAVVDSKKALTDAIHWNLEEGVLTFYAPEDTALAGKTFKCMVNVHGSSKTASLNIKIPSAKPALSLKVSGTIDEAVPNSPVTVTPKITNYHVGSGEAYSLRVIQSTSGTDVTRMFTMTQDGGVLTITAAASVPKNFTYTAYISTVLDEYRTIRCEKSFKLPVKWSDPAKISVSASLKASGSIDVIRPDTAAVLTPTFKNLYGFQLSESNLVFYKNKTAITGKVPFTVKVENGAYVISNNGADSSAKYTVSFKAVVNGKTVTSSPTTLPVKMGTLKAVSNVKSVTLLKNDRYDSKTIYITLPEDVCEVDHLGQDGVSAGLYTVTDLGGSAYRIAFRDRIPASKGSTIKLNIYLKGNLTGKPNASVSVKVNLQ